jgi:hypothetical protein
VAKLYRKKIHASMKYGKSKSERERDTQISHRGNVGHEWQFPAQSLSLYFNDKFLYFSQAS